MSRTELQSDFSFCRIFTEFYEIVMRMCFENKTMVLKRSGIHLGDRSQEWRVYLVLCRAAYNPV